MIRRKFMIVQFDVKDKLNLSLNEYAVCDAVYWLQRKTGWCFCSRQSMAEFLGLTKRGVIVIVDRLVGMGVLKKNDEGHLQTTRAWDDEFDYCDDGDEPHEEDDFTPIDVNSTRPKENFTERETLNSPETVKKMYKNGEITGPKEYYKNTSKNTRKEYPPLALKIRDYLNRRRREALNKRVDFTTIPKCVTARIGKDNITFEDAALVIDSKIEEWGGDEKMEKYITLDTLFADGNYQRYLVQAKENRYKIYEKDFKDHVKQFMDAHAHLPPEERRKIPFPKFEEWLNDRLSRQTDPDPVQARPDRNGEREAYNRRGSGTALHAGGGRRGLDSPMPGLS